jgi:hypothetical protein
MVDAATGYRSTLIERVIGAPKKGFGGVFECFLRCSASEGPLSAGTLTIGFHPCQFECRAVLPSRSGIGGFWCFATLIK